MGHLPVSLMLLYLRSYLPSFSFFFIAKCSALLPPPSRSRAAPGVHSAIALHCVMHKPSASGTPMAPLWMALRNGEIWRGWPWSGGGGGAGRIPLASGRGGTRLASPAAPRNHVVRVDRSNAIAAHVDNVEQAC